MYLEHFQLQRMPFEIGPDPRFLWLGAKHQGALTVLRYGILESKGFVVITGEPGTGKSTLLDAVIASFGRDYRFARICDPALNEMDFFNFAADALEMPRGFQTKGDFLIELGKFAGQGGSRQVILVIDEAQRLTSKMLEQIRVFSNMEHAGQKSVSTIFAGQPEFMGLIKQNRALSQRVFFTHAIHPLSAAETGAYIAHRLKVAGRVAPLFTPSAVQEVFRLSQGVPRLINLLCDHALVTGYGSHLTRIGPELVRESVEGTLIPTFNLAIAPGTAPGTAASGQGVAPWRSRKAVFGGIAALALLLTAAVLYRGGGGQGDPGSAPSNAPTAVEIRPVPVATGSSEARHAVQQEVAELRAQKDATDARLADMQRRFEQLEGELQGLKGARERAAGLEKTVAAKEAALAALREQLEASAQDQAAAVAELQERHAAAAALQSRPEGENARQQPQELKPHTAAPATPAPAPPLAPGPAATAPQVKSGAEPDPAGAIDLVIKRRAPSP